MARFDLVEAQEKYCNDKGLPCFIGYDGRCPNCGRDIFGEGGYSEDDAANMMITRCPFCATSFCE